MFKFPQNKQPLIPFLMGPTASGKTQLAVELVQKFPFEIVSVDSALIYRELNIGTAKPDDAILKIAPHHLINICDPKEHYSVAQFRLDALNIIGDILKRKKIPLLVGGTMMYFRILQNGIASLPSASEAIRDEIYNEGMTSGWDVLHERLKTIDPAAALRIHAHDRQRIQRALEVYAVSGKNISTWQGETCNQSNYCFLPIAIAPQDRSILHKRIELRFDEMLSAGFIEEVRQLYKRGDLSLSKPAMRAVGYRQVWEFLENKYSQENMREKAIIATRQFAKRQLTWLRSWPKLTWFDSTSENLSHDVINFLKINFEI